MGDGDSSQLADKVALVTGASRGIGEGIAHALARAGAEVVLVSRGADALERVLRDIEAGGGRARARPTDLSDLAQVQALVDDVGPIDVLVNNAAADEQIIPVLECADDHWAQTFAVDFWAPQLLMRELGRGMADRGGGVIINISSISAQQPIPFCGAYVASKAALDALTKVFAMELAASNVRCNVIAPGIMKTALTEPMLDSAMWDYMRGTIPAGRAGTVAEVAEVALWLASDAATFINGQIINVDGGATSGHFGVLGVGMAMAMADEPGGDAPN